MHDVCAKNADKKENGEVLLRKGAISDAQQTEEEVVNDSEPTASQTLSIESSSAMSKIVNAMTSLCTIYDAFFSNLAEWHELRVREDRSRPVDFVLADSPYSVRRDQEMTILSMVCSRQTI